MFLKRDYIQTQKTYFVLKLSLISLRVGLPISKAFGMEELLMKYSVDVAVWAHEHEYERTWPLYDYRYAITVIIGY